MEKGGEMRWGFKSFLSHQYTKTPLSVTLTGASSELRLGSINPERSGRVIGGGARRERAASLLDKNIEALAPQACSIKTLSASHSPSPPRPPCVLPVHKQRSFWFSATR